MRYYQDFYANDLFIESFFDEVFRDDDNIIKSIEHVVSVKHRVISNNNGLPMDYKGTLKFLINNHFIHIFKKLPVNLNCGRLGRLAMMSKMVHHEKEKQKKEAVLASKEIEQESPDKKEMIDQLLGDHEYLVNIWDHIYRFYIQHLPRLCHGSYNTYNPDTTAWPTTHKPVLYVATKKPLTKSLFKFDLTTIMII